MNNIYLKTINLEKTYTVGDENVYALSNCNIAIEKGEQVAVMGPSGSGKSTLLTLIGGVIKPTKGEILLGDTDITKLSENELAKFRRRNIGFVFQDFRLIPEMTAKQNIQLPLMLDGKKLDKDYFNSLCERLMIQDRLYHLPSQLSGGQKQRVAIARALITNPDVILCDEPTGNLDSKSGSEVIELLKHICENDKKTLIIVTHDEKLATKLDRIIKIYDSEVIE